ncbi:hypothetical protein IIC65_06970, partial [Candidatus Sumerlaeota bacterium]|nr:hypothetical protein [Candidatus Sumerlaeota bacterium]
MGKTRLYALRAVTLLGVVISAYLVKQHIEFVLGEETGGFCRIFSAFDCDAVEGSRFSEVAGIPTASFGVLYFILFFAFLCTARPAGEASEPWPGFRDIAATLSLAGLLTSVALAFLSGVIIGSFCIGCSTIYAITLINAGLVGWGRFPAYPKDAGRGVPAALAALKNMMPRDETWERSIGRTWALWIVFVLAPLNFALPVYFTHVSNPFFDAFG